MGETVSSLSPAFNRSVHVELTDERTSSDAGAVALREALDASAIVPHLESTLIDERDASRVVHPLSEQFRTLVLQRAQGWNDLHDAATLGPDRLWSVVRSDVRGLSPLQQPHPSQATLSRMIDSLAKPGNRQNLQQALVRLAGWRLRQPRGGRRLKSLTLDIDGLPIEVFGRQGSSAFNGHTASRIYSPLVASVAETGDMVGALLREGRAAPSAEAADWIPSLVQALHAHASDKVQVRFDAGFTGNPTLQALEQHGIEYLGRLRPNPALDRKAEPYLKRPPGRPPYEPRQWCHEFSYQAESWPQPRRVVLVVQERPDDLLLHHFYIVTNLDSLWYTPEQVLRLYRRRGKAEAHMGELKSVLDVHLGSTDRGCSTVQQVDARNEVQLLISLFAYEVLHVLRDLLQTRTGEGWSLARLREQVLKVAALTRIHARQLRIHLGVAGRRWWPALMAGLAELSPAR